jgi:predicted secreted Zn-dependent protease
MAMVACGGGGSTAPANGTEPAERVQLQTSLNTTYYIVQGSTTEAMFAYIERNGPTDGQGRRGSGLTSVLWGYEWKGNARGGQCTIQSMSITADMTVTLPQHIDVSALSPTIRENWQEYASGVAIHEQTHVDIYLEGAQEIKRRMEDIAPQPSCESLEQRIQTIWSSEQTRINALQELFHEEEDLRLTSRRQPLQSKIDANRSNLTSLQREIDALDARIRSLRDEVASLERQADALDAQIKQINQQYPGTLPAPVRTQLEQLVARNNEILNVYNARVEEHNRSLARRNELAREHESLVSLTNSLVEEYNWAR